MDVAAAAHGTEDAAIGPDDGHSRRRWDQPARALVVLLTLVVAVTTAGGAVRATRSGAQLVDPTQAPGRDFARDMDNLRGQLVAKVPPGSRVFPAAGPEGGYSHQRTAQIAITEGYPLASTPEDADVSAYVLFHPPGDAGPLLVLQWPR
jgi:hypothetical protein